MGCGTWSGGTCGRAIDQLRQEDPRPPGSRHVTRLTSGEQPKGLSRSVDALQMPTWFVSLRRGSEARGATRARGLWLRHISLGRSRQMRRLCGQPAAWEAGSRDERCSPARAPRQPAARHLTPRTLALLTTLTARGEPHRYERIVSRTPGWEPNIAAGRHELVERCRLLRCQRWRGAPVETTCGAVVDE